MARSRYHEFPFAQLKFACRIIPMMPMQTGPPSLLRRYNGWYGQKFPIEPRPHILGDALVAILLAMWHITGYLDESNTPMQVRDHRGQMFIVSSVMFLSAGLGELKGRPKTGAAIAALVALLVAFLLTPAASRWIIYILLR